jgi:Carboxypeptidase regulatory-like domain
MKRSSIAFGLAASVAALVGACDDRSPTSPNRVSPPAQPVYSLTGVVTEPVGVPVEGATVTVVDGPYKGKASSTDSAGHYALIGVDGSFTVQVDKDGYTSSTKPVTVPQILALDVEITPLAISGNIGGNWTVTFEPHSSCPSPLNVDPRKYRASIHQQDAQLTITLSGATFATPPQLTGTIHDLNVSIALPAGVGCGFYDFYCYYGFTTPPAVIENLGGNQFLAISGQIAATVGRSSITGTLSGDFALMRPATPPFDTFATCTNANHRVTFSK